MSSLNTNAVLNQILAMHNRSLPAYLTYASPTWDRGDEKARETLAAIAADQRETADRAAAMIYDNDGVASNGAFPMYYTGYHDLSFDFLLNELIKEQKEDIAELDGCVDALALVPLAKALAQEALGAAKGHLDSLEELRHSSAAV